MVEFVGAIDQVDLKFVVMAAQAQHVDVKMKYLIIFILFSNLGFSKGTSVKGYRTKTGTYIQPYKRTEANSTKMDNYSYKGNINPYNGKKGYKK